MTVPWPALTPPPVRRVVLDNGLTLLLESDPGAHTVAAGYFVASGARDEAAARMGVSHFLEHLMFKGSERLGADELNERLDSLGGQVNAYTGEESTAYYASGLPEEVEAVLEHLTELMRPALRPNEIETERGVILEEIAMYDEDPGTRLWEALGRAYWGEHGLGHRILGTPETVRGLNRDALAAHLASHYGAPQVTLVVTGAFDDAEVEAWARRELSGWPNPGPRPPAPAPTPPRPCTLRLRDDHLTRAQGALLIPGPSAHSPLREAATVLAELLGGGSGALYWALMDPGLADSASFGRAAYRDVGSYWGGFSCDPERTEEVLGTFQAELRGVAGLVTEAAVRRAARKVVVSGLLRASTPQGRLFSLGSGYVQTGELRHPAELAERYARVGPADVLEVLRRYPLEQACTALLGPGPNFDPGSGPGPG